MGMRGGGINAKQINHTACQIEYAGRVQKALFYQWGLAIAFHGQIVGHTHITGNASGDPVRRDVTDAGIDDIQR